MVQVELVQFSKDTSGVEVEGGVGEDKSAGLQDLGPGTPDHQQGWGGESPIILIGGRWYPLLLPKYLLNP